MRKYVLYQDNAIVLNGKVYALVGEEEIANNSVCAMCSLSGICIDDEGNHHLSELCIPEHGSERWFFVDAGQLNKFLRSELNYSISANINNL